LSSVCEVGYEELSIGYWPGWEWGCEC